MKFTKVTRNHTWSYRGYSHFIQYQKPSRAHFPKFKGGDKIKEVMRILNEKYGDPTVLVEVNGQRRWKPNPNWTNDRARGRLYIKNPSDISVILLKIA
jgi:hypothetical protein